MKKEINYIFHHLGIPTSHDIKEGTYSSNVKMYTKDNNGKFRVQWHFFEEDSPLHPLIKEVPHVAFKVKDLQKAIKGEEVILGPYEPIDDYYVAIINDSGVPIELIQTNLSDDELWQRAREKKGSLYR